MRDIGTNIRRLRCRRKLTQDELAEALFVTRQTVSNYETGKSRPDVEMLIKISHVLGTDIQQLIYGPEPFKLTGDIKRLILGAAAALVLLTALIILSPIVKDYRAMTFLSGFSFLLHGTLRPLMWLCIGWTLAQLLGMALKQQPLKSPWVIHARRAAVTAVTLCLLIVFAYVLVIAVDDWLYASHIRGVWEETSCEANGVTVPNTSWSNLPLPLPEWFQTLAGSLLLVFTRYWPALPLTGGVLWLLDFPFGKKKAQ